MESMWMETIVYIWDNFATTLKLEMGFNMSTMGINIQANLTLDKSKARANY